MLILILTLVLPNCRNLQKNQWDLIDHDSLRRKPSPQCDLHTVYVPRCSSALTPLLYIRLSTSGPSVRIKGPVVRWDDKAAFSIRILLFVSPVNLKHSFSQDLREGGQGSGSSGVSNPAVNLSVGGGGASSAGLSNLRPGEARPTR